MSLFIIFLSIVTVVWAAFFIVPLVGYAMLGWKALQETETTTKTPKQPVVNLKHSHA